MSDCRQCVDFEWCKEYEECGLFKPKIMTKADEIRAMTDEELAEFLGAVTAGGYGMCAPGHYDCSGKDSCAPCWLDWPKEEVSE